MWSDTFVATVNDFAVDFTYCGEIVECVIPLSGYYRFEARGAKADDGEMRQGGFGVIIEATFYLQAG